MAVSNAVTPVDDALMYVNQNLGITMVGLPEQVRERLTRRDAEQLLVASGALEDVSRWIISDVLVWAENSAAQIVGNRNSREFWDKRDVAWLEVLRASKSDISHQTCYNMAACARAWPYERRRYSETISFEHHRLLVGKNDDEKDYWMELVESGGWSVRRLRSQLFGGNDPLAPATLMSARELWSTDRIKETVYEKFNYAGTHITSQIISFAEQIKGEYEHEIQRLRERQGSPQGY